MCEALTGDGSRSGEVCWTADLIHGIPSSFARVYIGFHADRISELVYTSSQVGFVKHHMRNARLAGQCARSQCMQVNPANTHGSCLKWQQEQVG